MELQLQYARPRLATAGKGYQLMDDKLDPKVLENVDEAKRSSLRKIIIGSAFAIPVIASFTMSGLGVSEAQAQCANCTKPPTKHHERHHGHDRRHHDDDRHRHDKFGKKSG